MSRASQVRAWVERGLLLVLLAALAWVGLDARTAAPRSPIAVDPREIESPALRHLLDVGIGTAGGDPYLGIRRWRGRVPVALTGDIRAEDREVFASALRRLGGLSAEAAFQEVDLPPRGGIEIRLLRSRAFPEALPGARPQDWTVSVWWDAGGELTRGLVLVASDRPASRRRAGLQKGLVRAAGLVGARDLDAPSGLPGPGGPEAPGLTELDWQALELLYHRGLRAGDTPRRVVEVLGSDGKGES